MTLYRYDPLPDAPHMRAIREAEAARSRFVATLHTVHRPLPVSHQPAGPNAAYESGTFGT